LKQSIVEEAARLLDLALLPCHRREAGELFTVERCARMLGGFESNLLSVEVECPALQQLLQSAASQSEATGTKEASSQKTPACDTHSTSGDSEKVQGDGSDSGPVYPPDLLARASEAVMLSLPSSPNDSVCAKADAITAPANTNTNTNTNTTKLTKSHRRRNRGSDNSTSSSSSGSSGSSMLSSSWPCSEGVGL
jgi:hypothetical protein